MLNKPKIELKNIKFLASLSDETPCYEATIYVDGEKFSKVINHGHGGSDEYHDKNWKDVERLDKLIAKTYPKIDGYDVELDESLECLCHGIVWDHVERKSIQSKMARKAMIVDDGKLYSLNVSAKKLNRTQFKFKFPNATLLNDLPFDKAWEIIKTCDA